MEPTVAIICGSTRETTICEAIVDDIHSVHASIDGVTACSWGTVGGHQVVFASPSPHGEDFVDVGAAVQALLNHSRNIRAILLVGVGESVGAAGVRLGDVVVESSCPEDGGFVRHGVEKLMQDADITIQRTEQPRHGLKSVILKLSNDLKYFEWKSYLEPELRHMLTERSWMPQLCGRLFEQIQVKKPETDASPSLGPKIRLGCIASGSQVIKTFKLGNRMVQDHSALILETEASHRDSDIPCLLIRGVADLIDGHRSSNRAKLAATVTAAAFARRFLNQLSISEIAMMPPIRPLVIARFSNVSQSEFSLIGRHHILSGIADYYEGPRKFASPLIVNLRGRAASSNTAHALRYCRLYAAKYANLLWINCDSALSISEGFSELSALIDVQATKTLGPNGKRDLVLRWLQASESSWLLVLDNVRRASEVSHLLSLDSEGMFNHGLAHRSSMPANSPGNILITTQDNLLPGLGLSIDVPLDTDDDCASEKLKLISDPENADFDLIYVEALSDDGLSLEPADWLKELLSQAGLRSRLFHVQFQIAPQSQSSQPWPWAYTCAHQLLKQYYHCRLQGHNQSRKSVFIARGLGVVIVKSAIIEACKRLDGSGSFVNHVLGLVFLATPSGGAASSSFEELLHLDAVNPSVAEKTEYSPGSTAAIDAEFEQARTACQLEVFDSYQELPKQGGVFISREDFLPEASTYGATSKSPRLPLFKSHDDAARLSLLQQIKKLIGNAGPADVDSNKSGLTTPSLSSASSEFKSNMASASVLEIADTREAFVQIIIRDPRLQDSLAQVPPSIKLDELQNQLQRLLMDLSHALRQSSCNKLERGVSRVAKKFATYAAFRICSKHAQDANSQAKSFRLEGRDDTVPSFGVKTEALSAETRSATQSLVPQDTPQKVEIDVTDDFADDDEHLPHIWKAEDFIVHGDAFAAFIDALSTWIVPKASEAPQQAVPQDTNADIDKDAKDKDKETDKDNKTEDDKGKDKDAEDEEVVQEPVLDITDSSAHLMDSNTSVMEHSRPRYSIWTNVFNVHYRMVKAFERKLFAEVIQPLEPGKIRVEWLCTCQQTLACDFDAASAGDAKAWLAELRRANYACRLTSYEADPEDASTPLNSDRYQSYQSEQSDTDTLGDASARLKSSEGSSRFKDRQRATKPGSESPTPNPEPNAASSSRAGLWTDAQWTVLAFLVNEPQLRRHVLGTVHKDSSGDKSDAQVVAQWRAHYEKAKGFWWRYISFMNITDALVSRMMLGIMPDGNTEGILTAPWLPNGWKRRPNEWSPCPSSCQQFDDRAKQLMYTTWILHYWRGTHESQWIRLRTRAMQALVNPLKDCLLRYSGDVERCSSSPQDSAQKPHPRLIQCAIPQRLQQLLEGGFEDLPDAWGVCLLEDIDTPGFLTILFFIFATLAMSSALVAAIETSVKHGVAYFPAIFLSALAALTFFFLAKDKIFDMLRGRSRHA